MPIIIPIQDADLEASVAGVLLGSTTMAGALTMRRGLRGGLFGATQMQGALGGDLALAGALNGSTDLTGFLRINTEPNVFLAGALEGSTEMAGALGVDAILSGELRGSTEMAGALTVGTETEPSITIFVDIIDTAIAAAQNSSNRRYASRLLVDGVQIPIRSATLEARKDTLGTELRVVLARADTTQVSFASVFTFQIGLWVSGAWVWISLLEGGKLSSLENPIRNEGLAPADQVSISIVDVIADRWNRAPRAPIHLYDSLQSAAPSEDQIAAQRIEIQTGGVILPVNTAMPGMKLTNVLDAAYVTGTGFSEVITNIPDFPVAEADFTLDGGYDAGVRPLLTLFAPLLFERNNVLFIIDPDGPLPAGFSPRTFPQSLTRELTDSMPQREPVNAIILRLRRDAGSGQNLYGDYYTEITNTSTSSAGDPDTDSYTETTIDQTVRSYRNFTDPNTVIRQEVIREVTTIRDWQANIIEVTELREFFNQYNLKTGHVRNVAKRMPDLNDIIAGEPAMNLLDVLSQQQQITYRMNPVNIREQLQDTVTTVESGLILVDPDNQYLGQPYRIPYIDGHVSGYINGGGAQRIEWGSLRTITESLWVAGKQVRVDTRIVNHLANTITQGTTTSRPGAIGINRNLQTMSGGPAGTGGRLMLITVPGTDALGRRAPTFDAGMLPSDIAIDLGERKLRRLNSPPRQLALTPAFVDLTIKRGSLLEIEARGVTVGSYIVEGYSINFAEYQPEIGAAVSMNVSCREIKE